MSDAGPSNSEYAIPKPSRIKLKETNADKATRLYRREQRRHRNETTKISRANGYAVSPPRPTRSDSISPPRNAPRTRVSPADHVEVNGTGHRWMGGLGVSAAEELERRDREERMRWLEQEEVSRASGDPFPTYDRIPQPIPRRYRDAAGLIGTSTGKGRTKRDPAREVELEGGGVPPLGEMDEEEYAEWVRAGMYRLKHRAEAEERERAQRVKEEKERAKSMAKEQVRKEEKKRIERLKAEKSLAEEEKRKKERERYRSRWIRITEVGGEVEESELRYDDVPWPVHPGHEVEKETIRTFLLALAKDDGDDVGGLRKVQREAIRAFHPDRFFGRVLARVREGDREKVKAGVERCSRILNDLAAEHRESGWVTRMES